MSLNPKLAINSKLLQIQNNQLQNHLLALTKEKEIVIRCLQHEEVLFRNKYAKFYSKKSSYDTQKRKNVSSKNPAPESNVNQDNCSVHSLIFSGNEIDIEKVLCLHLLTSYHYSNSQEVTSLQGLLKQTNTKEQVNKFLPNYIAEFYYKSKLLEDSFESSPIKGACFVINSYLENLLGVIVNVLQEVNPIKLEKLVKLSKKPITLDNVMQKQKILTMVDKLKDNPLVTDIINFRIEMGYLIDFTTSENNSNSLTMMRIKIKDANYKFHLIKQEINRSLRKRTQKRGSTGLNSTLSLLEKKLLARKPLNLHSILTLANKFINLSSLSMLKPEELAFIANIESMLQPNSNFFLKNQSKIVNPLSIYIRNSLYSNTSRYGSTIMPHNTYTLRAKRCVPIIESENERIMQSILQKLSHAQRIMIGKRAAQLKSLIGLDFQKTTLASLIGDVLTTDSLISLACSSQNEELEVILAPCSLGGLGIGTQIAENQNESHFTMSPPRQQIGLSNLKASVTDMNAIKHDLLTYELKSKVNSFLQTENP